MEISASISSLPFTDLADISHPNACVLRSIVQTRLTKKTAKQTILRADDQANHSSCAKYSMFSILVATIP